MEHEQLPLVAGRVSAIPLVLEGQINIAMTLSFKEQSEFVMTIDYLIKNAESA